MSREQDHCTQRLFTGCTISCLQARLRRSLRTCTIGSIMTSMLLHSLGVCRRYSQGSWSRLLGRMSFTNFPSKHWPPLSPRSESINKFVHSILSLLILSSIRHKYLLFSFNNTHLLFQQHPSSLLTTSIFSSNNIHLLFQQHPSSLPTTSTFKEQSIPILTPQRSKISTNMDDRNMRKYSPTSCRDSLLKICSLVFWGVLICCTGIPVPVRTSRRPPPSLAACRGAPADSQHGARGQGSRGSRNSIKQGRTSNKQRLRRVPRES